MSASGSRIHVRTTHLPIHSSNLHSSLFFFFCFFLPSSFFIPYSLFPFRLPHQLFLALPYTFKPSNYTLTQPTHQQKSLNISPRQTFRKFAILYASPTHVPYCIYGAKNLLICAASAGSRNPRYRYLGRPIYYAATAHTRVYIALHSF